MPKNKGKGGKNKGKRGKNRKRGKNESDDENRELEFAQVMGMLGNGRCEARELVFKEDGQEYAQVMRILVGNGRCEALAMCIDGVERLCPFRGKVQMIGAGDIILVGLRDYQDDKADVLLKYMPDEARLLKDCGELPEDITLKNPKNMADEARLLKTIEGIVGGLDEEDDGAGDDYIDGVAGGLDEEDDGVGNDTIELRMRIPIIWIWNMLRSFLGSIYQLVKRTPRNAR